MAFGMNLTEVVSMSLRIRLPAIFIVATVVFASEAAAQWEGQWEKVVTAAKKEGEISIYLNAPAQVRPALTKAFEEKFGIKSYVVTGTGPELSAKIVSVQRRIA